MLIGYARVSKADGKGLAAFVVLLSLAFAACGGDKQSSPTAPTPIPTPAPTPPTSSNQAPQASGSIPAQELTVGAAAGMVDVAQYFSDPAGDALTYAADSNDAGTVTASVSGSILTLTPVAAGMATVTVTARDPGGLSATQTIDVTVLRLCADERERAENHSGFVFEWDGTPFRVDMIRNFPDFVTEADIASLLAPVGLLADKIERQLGYQILEMGEVIPIPRGTPPGWDEDTLAFRRNCPLPRDRGHILGFYMDDVLESAPSAGAQAHPRCGAFTYLRPGVGRRWPCSGCSKDGATVHEIFHVLGFVHADDYDFLERGDGVAMSEQLTDSDRWRGADAVTWADIDLLRCIFPQGG